MCDSKWPNERASWRCRMQHSAGRLEALRPAAVRRRPARRARAAEAEGAAEDRRARAVEPAAEGARADAAGIRDREPKRTEAAEPERSMCSRMESPSRSRSRPD